MRHDVTFLSQGQRISAWLHVPDTLAEGRKAPAVVMAHGFSCVKEQGLNHFAESFCAAGMLALVFDYRCFGHSGGEPRGQLFALEQVEDYRNAISWLSAQPQVDAGRIGAWGTSFSGGLVLHLAVFDRRVKAVVAQVPSVLNCDNSPALAVGDDAPLTRFLLEDRAARHATGVVNRLPVVAPEGQPCVLSGRECHEAYMALSAEAPSWRNEITVESLEKLCEFDPIQHIQRIAPTPLLLIGAEQDTLIPVELVVQAHERAREPKELLLLPCRHFDVYTDGAWRTRAAAAATEWFRRHL